MVAISPLRINLPHAIQRNQIAFRSTRSPFGNSILTQHFLDGPQQLRFEAPGFALMPQLFEMILAVFAANLHPDCFVFAEPSCVFPTSGERFWEPFVSFSPWHTSSLL